MSIHDIPFGHTIMPLGPLFHLEDKVGSLPDTCKTVFQNLAVQITVNDLFDVGAKEPVLPFESVVIDQFECLEKVFHALVVW